MRTIIAPSDNLTLIIDTKSPTFVIFGESSEIGHRAIIPEICVLFAT